jgi:hypothetical protein
MSTIPLTAPASSEIDVSPHEPVPELGPGHASVCLRAGKRPRRRSLYQGQQVCGTAPGRLWGQDPQYAGDGIADVRRPPYARSDSRSRLAHDRDRRARAYHRQSSGAVERSAACTEHRAKFVLHFLYRLVETSSGPLHRLTIGRHSDAAVGTMGPSAVGLSC